MSTADNRKLGDRKRALDQALDDAARAAEQELAQDEPLGIWLVPLDEHLEPLDVVRLPAHRVPPTRRKRRWLMESLVPQVLAGAAGYIAVAEACSTSERSNPLARAEVILLQAETRAGDSRVLVYPIIWSDAGPPRLAPPREEVAKPQDTFARLLRVADAFHGCVDETLLQVALAAHAEAIDTLGEEDILLFAVGDQLVQVIGPQHTVRLCTTLRLRDIKAAAAAGDAHAQRSYFELTAGQGIFTHLDWTDESATITFAADRARPHAPSDRRPKNH
jgi:hypothetical protein